MKINKDKLYNIAVEENEKEKLFSLDLSENKDLYKASMRIALKIKRALKLLNLTQNDLAKKMDLDPSIISRSLNGKANLELKTIVKFEDILGINIIDRRISPYSKEKTFHYINYTINNVNIVINSETVKNTKKKTLTKKYKYPISFNSAYQSNLEGFNELNFESLFFVKEMEL